MLLYQDSREYEKKKPLASAGKRFFYTPDKVTMSTLMSCRLSQAEDLGYVIPSLPTYFAGGMQPIRMNTMFGLAHVNDGEVFR